MVPDLPELEVIGAGLLAHHKHFLVGQINSESVTRAVQWIIYENTQPTRPDHLTMYINSEGGDLYDTFALIDIMLSSLIPVYTVGIGSVMSAAGLIVACGERGHRYLGRHTGIMMHQFYTDMEGKQHELVSAMKELANCKTRVADLLKRGGSTQKIQDEKLLLPSDVWLTAAEAIKLKLADKIFTTIL